VIHRGGQRGEDPDARWDPRAAGRGGSGLSALVSGRRAHGWEGATGPGTGGRDAAGMGRPHGGSGAHGGPVWCRGRRRITTRTPCPQGRPCWPAWGGAYSRAGGRRAWSGDVRGAEGAWPARQRWRRCRRDRCVGLHSPEDRTVWQPRGHTCGRQQRIHAWAGRVMVCHRWVRESTERQQIWPWSLERMRELVKARRWTYRPQ
jgi:hypothetical protein